MSQNPSDPYYRQTLATKEKLNKVSPSFCLAKWLQVSIHLTTGRTHSCYHPVPHKIPLDELGNNPGALHNTKYKKEQRKKMKEGIRPEECTYCWQVEDLKGEHLSDRFFRSSEEWALPRFSEVVNNPWDYDVLPAYVEVNFNQACQLKCTYCSPVLSSSWEQEMKKRGPYALTRPHVPVEYFEKEGIMPIPLGAPNPYVEAFWKWWPSLYPELKVFRMTGGEPLLDENTFKVLDYAKEHSNKELSISITSNMCPPDKNFDRFIKVLKEILGKGHIKSFLLFASIDTVGPQSEYIRWGLNYSQFMKNIHRVLSEVPQASVTFINTFNLMSVVGFEDFLSMVQGLRSEYSQSWQRVHFDTPRLYSPHFLVGRLLTDRYFKILKTQIDWMKERKNQKEQDLVGFSETEIEKAERLLSWLKEPLDKKKSQLGRRDFYFFVQDYDQRRGLKFTEVFPEMKDFYELCQKESLLPWEDQS